MRFPKIGDVAAELRDINKQGLEPEDVDEGIDVRLQVYPDGEWAVRWGLSDYDQDHRGFWGAASVPGNNRRFNSKDVARDLIDQAKDQYAMNDGVEETPTQVKSDKQLPLPGFEEFIKLPNMPMWEQIGGDMDPAAHGGLIARSDNDADGNPIALELVEIQPVRAYVGDSEAAEVGFPFWSREAWYDLNDLNPERKEVRDALRSIGMTIEELSESPEGRKAAGERGYTPEQRALVIAEALMGYGTGVNEGPSGWSSDIYADEEVKWWSGPPTTIEAALAEEDDEFRREVLGEEDEEEVDESLRRRRAHAVREPHRARAPSRTTPTAKNILEWLGDYMEHEGLDAPRESARLARLIANARTNRQVEETLEEVNRVIGGHGVEAIRVEGAHIDNYHFDIVATYVNMGDPYVATLLHESESGRFVLTTWGDWFEEHEHEYTDRESLDERRTPRTRAAQGDRWFEVVDRGRVIADITAPDLEKARLNVAHGKRGGFYPQSATVRPAQSPRPSLPRFGERRSNKRRRNPRRRR